MTPFLRQVAHHYLQAGPSLMKNRCFVFPNRRSIAFFRKHLADIVRDSDCGPIVLPQLVTINDFFTRTAALRLSDRVGSLFDLYSVYKQVYPSAETIDQFIYWGDVILGDFNDVDKYLVNPGDIFTNISDLKSISDDYSHLTDTQREAILRFLGHFAQKDARVTANLSGGKGLDTKSNFKEIWDVLYPLYEGFNKLLLSRGEAYEGMIYRSVAEKAARGHTREMLSASWPHSESFVFVGLNALNQCEKTLLRKMKELGIAEFCWDYAGDMISDGRNKASMFMKENLKLFPQAFETDVDGVARPHIKAVSVPSSVGQVKLVSDIVSGSNPEDCAVVLPDESLLMPLLESLDPSIDNINVTMGYPLATTELHSLMKSLSDLQDNVRTRDGRQCYWYKPVREVFANGVFRKLMSGSEAVNAIVRGFKDRPSSYIFCDILVGDPLLELMFTRLVPADGESAVSVTASWQKKVLAAIAGRLAGNPQMALEMDMVKDYWCCVNRLEGIAASKADIASIGVKSYLKLLDSLLDGMSVPFTGEPLKGMQIMGPLETRALDFKNVVLLSCNEGVFPGKAVATSFIPPELRRGFDMPTSDYKDAMWAYYFYRMISRAENVWLLYDSRTEGVKSGEESRFIKQLVYHFNADVEKLTASAPFSLPNGAGDVVKTQEHLDILRNKRLLSVSSIQDYIGCSLKFYFSKVENLRKDEDVSENLVAPMVGNVYHNTMRSIYMGEADLTVNRVFDKQENVPTVGEPYITKDYLKSLENKQDLIKSKIDFFITQELHGNEVSGRNLVMSELILRYVMRTIECDIKFLDRNFADAFHILGLEREYRCEIGGFRFTGYIDRLDSVETGTLSQSPGAGRMVRIIDYKTGSDKPKSLENLAGGGDDELMDTIFRGKHKDRSEVKALLQFYIYGRLLDGNRTEGGESLAICDMYDSMYAVCKMFKDDIPCIRPSAAFLDRMEAELDAVLAEISDLSVPFQSAADPDECKFCDFKLICGR